MVFNIFSPDDDMSTWLGLNYTPSTHTHTFPRTFSKADTNAINRIYIDRYSRKIDGQIDSDRQGRRTNKQSQRQTENEQTDGETNGHRDGHNTDRFRSIRIDTDPRTTDPCVSMCLPNYAN